MDVMFRRSYSLLRLRQSCMHANVISTTHLAQSGALANSGQMWKDSVLPSPLRDAPLALMRNAQLDEVSAEIRVSRLLSFACRTQTCSKEPPFVWSMTLRPNEIYNTQHV